MTKCRTAPGLNGFGWAHVVYGEPYDFDRVLRHAAKLEEFLAGRP